MTNYKRQYRQLDADTKEKISQAQKGKAKSETHKQHISQSLSRYWQTVPNRPSGSTPSVINGEIV